VECKDFTGTLPDDVCIHASKDDDGDELFNGKVSKGNTFTLTRDDDKFDSNTYIIVKDENCGTTLQEIQFHTSCSKPLETGYTFASSFLYACTTAPKD